MHTRRDRRERGISAGRSGRTEAIGVCNGSDKANNTHQKEEKDCLEGLHLAMRPWT